MVKLRWMNGEYIKKMEDDSFYQTALPYLKEVIKKDLAFEKIAPLIKTRIETFLDIRDMVDFFGELPDYDIQMYTHKKMKTDAQSSLAVLKDLLPRFEALEDYSIEEIENVIMSYIQEKGIKNGQGLWPVRTAVSGKQSTPGGAYEIMNILGKEESLRRIRVAIEKLS
jgi:glutamyl-tRNA synthetase